MKRLWKWLTTGTWYPVIEPNVFSKHGWYMVEHDPFCGPLERYTVWEVSTMLNTDPDARYFYFAYRDDAIKAMECLEKLTGAV